jgi:hypothetical protein
MIWDINDYIGNKNDFLIICEYDKEFKNFNIKTDINYFDFFD